VAGLVMDHFGIEPHAGPSLRAAQAPVEVPR
jgi:hypothetical protein